MSRRLFVALRPPPVIRDRLTDTMEGIENARWQSDEQLHLTLRYLGEVDERQVDDIAGELDRIKLAPFSLQLDGVGSFERKGVPRALWIRPATSEPLSVLQRKVERACTCAGCEAETRRFTPHITVARLNMSSGPIGGYLASGSVRDLPAWPVDAFLLFESHVSASGSEYNAIARFNLR